MTGNDKGNTLDQPDYGAYPLPDDEPKEDWGWRARRAYIFREWVDVGSERGLNKSQLARDFDVKRDTIYKDLDRIAQQVEDNLGQRHEAESVNVFRKAVDELLDEGEYAKAARVQSNFSEWLENRGAIDKEPEQVDARVQRMDPSDLDEEDIEFLEGVF